MPEHVRAKAWREAHGLSVDQLSELTGYGPRAIYWMERGLSPSGASRRKPSRVAPWVWHRYRMLCAGVDAQLRLKQKFDW